MEMQTKIGAGIPLRSHT